MSEEDLFDLPGKLTTDEYVSASIGDRRDELQMSQSEVAELMTEAGHKWTQSTVYKVESGNRKLTFTEGMELSRILQMSPYDLLSEDHSSVAVQRVLDSLRTTWYRLDGVVKTVDGAREWLEEQSDSLSENERQHLERALRLITERLADDSEA